MRLARVVGNVVATIKAEGLARYKLLLVRDADPLKPERLTGEAYAAIDLAGAGDGEFVLVAHGSAARVGRAEVPTDAAVVAIVDTVLMGTQVTFHKR
jgi:microcompartment protein CcmK/EutM